MSATLLVLAAGIGSRFKGGIKQLTPVGVSGELLMEYSVYDAVRAGFDKVVFIIRRDIEQQFNEMIGSRISSIADVSYCFQETDKLCGGYECPSERSKPWGTVHAVLSAAKHINEPFLIINADDYYGIGAYRRIYDFLTSENRKAYEQCMAGFTLSNTLSSTGTVTRGVCEAGDDGLLTKVSETYKIFCRDDNCICGERDGKEIILDSSSIVSMNMWGFSEQIMPLLKECMTDFLSKTFAEGNELSAEYPLPLAVDKLIKEGRISVNVLPTSDRWYGMTHRDDLTEITASFKEMTEAGKYPSPLFG
ncbi:MAG: NTP transferase domain-containing protein [Oscillospiraceae bacterium]|nr:NTP transferase domain-containing protein [Oscillospiraceae bacterium]